MGTTSPREIHSTYPSTGKKKEEISATSKMRKHSGKGTINYNKGDVYDGEFRDAEPHGIGKMTYKDGRVVEGIWENGEIAYEGELANGKPHGRGKRIYSNGEVYEGEWKDGKRHGKGTYKWSNGDMYEGEWKNAEEHGRGIKKYSSGSSYEGDWENGLKQGKGTFKWSDGYVYEGDWNENKKFGKGIRKRPDGSVVYDGEYKDNLSMEMELSITKMVTSIQGSGVPTKGTARE
jgi:hypothetical protein